MGLRGESPLYPLACTAMVHYSYFDYMYVGCFPDKTFRDVRFKTFFF